MSNVANRLDRLPFCGFHYRLLFMGGLGYMFEALDAAIIAFLLPVLRVQWNLSSVETGILGSSTFVGFLFGALFAGLIADKFGRRAVMMWALIIFCVAAFASAFVHDWHSFLVLRVIGGIGMGAEGAIVAPFLSEFVGTKYRGGFTASLAGFFSFGFVAAAIIGYFVVPINEDGWRYTVVITALPVLLILWWRRALLESPRWLVSRGRTAEAERIVDGIEAEIIRSGRSLSPVPAVAMAAPADVPQRSMWSNLAVLWSPRLRRITVMTWCLWFAVTFCSYAFFTWIPGLLVQQGLSLSKSFGYSILIYLAQVPGYFSAAYMCEKVGRRASIVGYMAGAALSAIGLAFVQDTTQMLGMSILLSFFMNGVNASEYAYTPEVFPTGVRATGVGTASAVGRIGAILSPVLVGYIYPISGFAGVFGMTTAVLTGGALAVILLGISTEGRSLEEISAEELGGGDPPVKMDGLKASA